MTINETIERLEKLYAQATPGEWEVEHHCDNATKDDPGYWTVEAEILKDKIGSVLDSLNRHHCIDPEQDEANARVSAALHNAAPDLFRHIREQAAMLQSVEWKAHSTGYSDEWIPCCPVCGGCEPVPYSEYAMKWINRNTQIGHYDRCGLAKLLKGTQ